MFIALMITYYVCCMQPVILWELSDNMVPYYEKFPIIDAVTMGTGVLGMHIEFLNSTAHATQE